jgi:DNA-binding HxlR family transcriptional regulator
MPERSVVPEAVADRCSYTSDVTQDAAHDAAEEHVPPQCDAALSDAFSLLGKRWNGVILGTLMTGPAGFSEIRRALGGISDSVLSDRLSELTAAGLVLREVDEGPPVGVRYQLAEPGKALMPALNQLMTWARNNL